MRILVVEDVLALQELIVDYLVNTGFAVDAAGTAEEGINSLTTFEYDALILDLGLPDQDGSHVLQARNLLQPTIPCLVLSARADLTTRVTCLNSGADDFLLKPFDFSELEARLHAVLRRSTRNYHQLSFGNVHFEPCSRFVSVAQKELQLTRRETMLLEEMLRTVPRIAVKDHLEERIYSQHEPVTLNAVEALVSRLRKKLLSAQANIYIQTVRGIGYRLCLRPVNE